MAYQYPIPRITEIELAGEPQRLRSRFVSGIEHLPIRYGLRPARGSTRLVSDARSPSLLERRGLRDGTAREEQSSMRRPFTARVDDDGRRVWSLRSDWAADHRDGPSTGWAESTRR